MSISDDLTRLAELRDRGVLTQEEFDQQKAKLLSGANAGETPLSPKTKSGFGKGCLIAVVVAVVLLVILAAIGSQVENKPGSVIPPTSSDSGTGEAIVSAQPETGVTMKNFNRIRNGMTYAEVVAILGEPSQELSRTEIAGTETVMYMWEGGLGANMNAMFQNGKLVSKAQFGLR